MRRNACPEGGDETLSTFDDEKTPPYFLLTPTADNVLADTAHHQEHFNWLEDKVRSHYHATGMYKQFPERAEMLVARWENNAGQVVARALADEEVMRRFMAMRDPGDLMLPYSVEEPMYAEGAGHLQTGEYGRFLQTLACHYLGALAAVFHHAQENSEHEGLWETLEAQQRNYRDAWCAYAREAEQRGVRELNPPFEPFGSMDGTAVGGIGNNMLTAQSVSLAHQRHFDGRWDPGSGEPYAAFMRRTALARTALLALPASTNRRVTPEIIPDPPATTAEDGGLVCDNPLSYDGAPRSFVTDENGTDRWATRRLPRGERWRVPGHCAGDVPHRPTPRGGEVVDAFFARMSEYAGGAQLGRDEDGRFSSVRVLLCIGQLVAERTMYKNRMK